MSETRRMHRNALASEGIMPVKLYNPILSASSKSTSSRSSNSNKKIATSGTSLSNSIGNTSGNLSANSNNHELNSEGFTHRWNDLFLPMESW